MLAGVPGGLEGGASAIVALMINITISQLSRQERWVGCGGVRSIQCRKDVEFPCLRFGGNIQGGLYLVQSFDFVSRGGGDSCDIDMDSFWWSRAPFRSGRHFITVTLQYFVQLQTKSIPS